MKLIDDSDWCYNDFLKDKKIEKVKEWKERYLNKNKVSHLGKLNKEMNITYKHKKTGKTYRWIDNLGTIDVFQLVDKNGFIKSPDRVYFNGFEDLERL